MGEDRDNPGGISVPPPLIYLGGLSVGLALHAVRPRRFLPARAARVLGTLLLCGGAMLSLWFGRTMWRAGTPFRFDEPAEVLVTGGPFRFSRNPGYLSFAMMQGGIACLANALWAALLLPATVTIIRRRVIEKEERYLEREFGGRYLRYKARVRRWL